MSFNTQHCLNYMEQKIDFEIMAKAIKTVGADVVGMQEMRGKGKASDYEEQTEKVSAISGLPYSYFGKAIYFEGLGPYGNALLSKYPIISAEVIPIPDPDPKTGDKYYETRALIKARLEGDITVLVTHFGLNEDEQRNAVKTVVENLEEKRCVLMGDFNVRPDSEILLPIRERMKDTADLFEEEKKSFPSDDPYMKIDYIFVSSDVQVVSADIPAIVASDHRPHTCELSL